MTKLRIRVWVSGQQYRFHVAVADPDSVAQVVAAATATLAKLNPAITSLSGHRLEATQTNGVIVHERFTVQ